MVKSKPVTCARTLTVTALVGVPRVQPNDDVAQLTLDALARTGIEVRDGDVLVVTSKLLSRAEGRFVDLAAVVPSPRARQLAAEVHKDPRLVELVLQESRAVSRAAPGVLIARHRLGFVVANAGIDTSNAKPAGVSDSGSWVLLLPTEPDRDAERIRSRIERASGARVGVVISDSHGRPFRLGTVGAAIGVAGLPALSDLVTQPDLDGRELESTTTAIADQVAATADLVAGQADEGRPLVLVRGLDFEPQASSARGLLRPVERDLYA
ncbi:MAG: coenzyme F420-0:L-glutamate ligase [Myxococcota bacterium]